MFRSCYCRSTSFWWCFIALCVVECVLTLLSTHLFLQLVPVLHRGPLPPTDVVGDCGSIEPYFRCRQGWAPGDRSFRCRWAQGSDKTLLSVQVGPQLLWPLLQVQAGLRLWWWDSFWHCCCCCLLMCPGPFLEATAVAASGPLICWYYSLSTPPPRVLSVSLGHWFSPGFRPSHSVTDVLFILYYLANTLISEIVCMERKANGKRDNWYFLDYVIL